jgi:hypothetical protein
MQNSQIKNFIKDIPNVQSQLNAIQYFLVNSDEFCQMETMERCNMYHLINQLKDIFKTPEQSPEPEIA